MADNEKGQYDREAFILMDLLKEIIFEVLGHCEVIQERAGVLFLAF